MSSDYIKNLQSKPESSKIKILWFFSGLMVVLVLMIWVSSFGEYKAAFNNPVGDNKTVSSLKASVLNSFVKNRQENNAPKIRESQPAVKQQENYNKNSKENTQNKKPQDLNYKPQTEEPKKKESYFKLPVE